MHRTVLAAALLGLGVFASSASADALKENFEGVAPPAVPASWAVSKTGANAVNWVSTATASTSSPNAMFAPDPSGSGCPPTTTDKVVDEILDSPTVTVGAAPKVSFENNYNTETTFDGGVLEISLNGGAFQDIVAAGGVFEQNGYNSSISDSYGSPIAGRPAWTGDSAGFRQTIVDLPSVTAGTAIQLRFRMTADCSIGDTGWWIDDLLVASAPAVSAVGSTAVSTDSAMLNGTLTTDLTGSYHYDYGTTDAYGSQTPDRAVLAGAGQAETEQLAGLSPDTTYHYRMVASNSIGSVTSDDQTLTTAALPAPTPPTTTTTVPAPPADTTAPDTTIDKAKVKDAKGQAKFSFSANEAGSHFECRLDKGDFAACTSPHGYKHLKDGKHKFYVRAIDAANNVDQTPAKQEFRIAAS